MTLTHPELVRALVKPPEAIIATMSPHNADLVHAVLGISGEAGELLDAVKKSVIYNKPLDLVNVVEELGDLEFYLEQLRQRLNITRDECLEGNIAKLSKRYDQLNYSDQAAQDRADKVAPAPAPEPERKFFSEQPRQEHDAVMSAIGHAPAGDGQEHSDIMREITGH